LEQVDFTNVYDAFVEEGALSAVGAIAKKVPTVRMFDEFGQHADSLFKNSPTTGEFSIIDWNGYPNGPKPEGPFRMLQGTEYDEARKAANSANRRLHRSDPSLKGLQLHEMKPVKFGGSPTDPANKVRLSPKDHAEYTKFWNRLQRDLNK
jgi:hypothetical protein